MIAIYLLSVFGFTGFFHVTFGERKFFQRKPFSCHLCMGFWFGLIFTSFFGIEPIQMIPYSFAASGFNWMMFKFITGEY